MTLPRIITSRTSESSKSSSSISSRAWTEYTYRPSLAADLIRRILIFASFGWAANLFLQPAKQPVKNCLAILFIDRLGQRNTHGTDLDAVLRIAAVGDPVFAHDSFKAFVAVHFPCWMHVEETHLSDCLWTDVMVFVILRTGFQATAARHT